jgi:diguanylate cyclase (GGDEF)-like protein
LQAEKDKRGSVPPFAVVVFDCNNLKTVNDQNGHDKGDIYLKNTAQVICEVFDHSPVFRIGGDEFTAILIGKDYENRKKLLQMFDEKCAEMRKHESDVWKQVDVARGIAEYNPQEEETISDVVRRADKNMYENKWNTKEERR